VKGDGIDPEKGGPGFMSAFCTTMRMLCSHWDGLMTLFAYSYLDFVCRAKAQKIDRIMEKFAEKFTTRILMSFPRRTLHLFWRFSDHAQHGPHNPSIKEDRRMTAESFIRNNRGIAWKGGDLPDEVLNGDI
jgi:brefeldin A-inhibited guanine nucleotide-exchange protein